MQWSAALAAAVNGVVDVLGHRPLMRCNTRVCDQWQARKLETELDSKLAAYGKLAAGYDSSYAAKGESGLAAEQVRLCSSWRR